MTSQNPEPTIYRIKKYPNRRFYDSTTGTHVTLQDLHDRVRAGHQIVVTDSKTGDEITNAVLAQIILELDPPKLELFPATLLHQAIQSNQKVIRGFIEQYFAQAMDAFVNSRERFEQGMKQMGLGLFPPSPPDWTRVFFGDRTVKQGQPARSPAPVPDEADASDSVQSLRSELESLRADLAELRGHANPRTTPKAPRKRPMSKRKANR